VESSELKELPKLPLIGNGDILSYSDYEEKVLAHPNLSKTAMLGRGALIKPWLPQEIKEKRNWDISASERLDFLKTYVRYGLEHWGSDQQGVNNTRRFLLEWLSFLHRYVPVGLLEVLPQKMNQRAPLHMMGRNDLETLFLSPLSSDWIKISEMLLGPVPDGFQFEPKHKASG
jgi:tRNA-dihydrouridine synthase 3